MPNTKQDIVSRLRKNILLWEGYKPAPGGLTAGIGLGRLESAFPHGVFPTGVIHEMVCPTTEHAAATTGFMAGVMASLMQSGGPCLWIGTSRKLFPSSLTNFNVEPDRIIFIDLQREKDVLWATEESLKCEGVAVVVAELGGISFAQSRRLQLAVENSRVTGFILRNDVRKMSTTTCVARWQITHLPSELEGSLPGVGFPRWQVELLKVRNGNPGSWKLEWVDGRFATIGEKIAANELLERKAG